MKATVTKYLNVRVGKPSLNAPCYQYLSPGHVVIVDGHTYPGDSFNGIDSWMKDSAGNYYWSGALDFNDTDSVVMPAKPQIANFNRLFLQIPDKFRNTRGAGTRIAILDTGIHDHLALKGAIGSSVNKSGSISGETDTNGHGTHCAGIIGARGDRLTGIAPDAMLYSAKVMDDNGTFKCRNVVEGLKWAINEQHADVVSCSFGIDDAITPELMQLLELAEKSNVIIVASAGENLAVTDKYPGFLNPAMMNGCIAIGAVNQFNSIGAFHFHPKLDFVMPNNNIDSCSIDGVSYWADHGSSMATAFVSGIIGLIISYYRTGQNKKVSSADIRNEMGKFAYSYASTIDFADSYQLIKCS